MSKQIYIDSNGNEVLVSGTIINDNNLPHYTGTPTAGTTAYEIKDLQDSIGTLNTVTINNTYATGNLYYKKLGNMVIVFGLITLTANVATGNLIFSGLPSNNNGANNVIKAINNDGTSADWVIYCGNTSSNYLSASSQPSGKSYTISFAYYTA